MVIKNNIKLWNHASVGAHDAPPTFRIRDVRYCVAAAVTHLKRRCRASLVARASRTARSSPPRVPGATCATSWGRTLEARDASGRPRSKKFFSPPGFVGVRRRPLRSEAPAGTSLGSKKVAQSQMQMLNRLAHGADRNVAPEPTSPRGREKTRSERG